MTDIEIARSVSLKNIVDVAKDLNIEEYNIEVYGKYKAKISNKVFENLKDKKNGKLILVTAISPTPLGEGKTTVSISIADGLRKIGKNSILALREPSLGPVFGIKGGAAGGGYSQVLPMEDINLHFTGDIHAITSANNLLSSLIDNHIYFGNELRFDKVVWKRCVDLNDRSLRSVEVGLTNKRKDKFDISVASEIMAILCLSKDIFDLRRRLANILVGYNKEGEAIYARDLKAEGSMTVLLKDAIKPNLVQTLEHTPAIIHGGPFANIAHGCNSVIATNLALKLCDYVVTEAGFGADLGAEKFLNIKCRNMNVMPDIVVLVATIKALKYHGGVSKNEVFNVNMDGLEKGMNNLFRHIDNLSNKFNVNVIVAINKYAKDTDEEINFLVNKLSEKGILVSIVDGFSKGGEGAIDISNKIVKLVDNKKELNYTYELTDTIEEKIKKVAMKIYGASDVIFENSALESIKKINELGYSNLPICIAKTQYSFSSDPKNLECAGDYNITISDVELKSGANFIVVYAGNIMTMPGLPKEPAAMNIDIDENGNVVGIF